MIENLHHEVVISIIHKYKTDGHSPYLVLTNGFHRYVLKTPNNVYDRHSILKEFLCTQLLHVWQISTPRIASLAISPVLTDTDFIAQDKRFNLSSVFFGSEFIEDSVDLQNFITASGKVALRKIHNANDLILISLFDIWTENDDRKPSNNNLLLYPEGKSMKLIPIDHAATFSSLEFSSLQCDELSFSDNDSILYCPLGKEVIRRANQAGDLLTWTREMFYLCTDNVATHFELICRNMPLEFSLSKEEIANLRAFLLNPDRNKKVFEQFTYIVESILR
jgi:hypothetical protein